MQNASLSTLTNSSHQHQKNSLKPKISIFFPKVLVWARITLFCEPDEKVRQTWKKNFGLKVQKNQHFFSNSYVSLHKFLWTREMQFPRHWRDTFAKSPQTLQSGSKNAAKSYNLFWKKRFIKESSRHAECKFVIPDENFSP